MAEDNNSHSPPMRPRPPRRLDSMRGELFRELNPERRREIETEAIQRRILAGRYRSRHALPPTGLLDYLSLGDDDDEARPSGPADRSSRSRSPSDAMSNWTSPYLDRNPSSLSVQGWNPYRAPARRPEWTREVPHDEARRRLFGETRAQSRHWPSVPGRLRYMWTRQEMAEHEERITERETDAYYRQSRMNRAREASGQHSLGHGWEGSNTQVRPDLDERARALVAPLGARVAIMSAMAMGGPASPAWPSAHARLRRRDTDEETLPPYSPPREEGLEDPPPAYTPAVGMSSGGNINQPG